MLLFAAILASACFADDESAGLGEPVERRPPAPSRYSSMADLLPRHAVGQRFAVLTDADVDVERIVGLAERFEEWSAGWLGESLGSNAEQPFPIYLCNDDETIYEIERRYQWRTSNHGGRTFEFRGGFYGPPGFIALPVRKFADLDPVVMHEIAHLVLSRIVDDPPDIVDEGVAEYLPELFRAADGASQPNVTFTRSFRQIRCEQGFEAGEVPPLAQLFDLGYWEFRDEKHENLNYSLGWHLVRFLAESDHEQVTGRFPHFLSHLSSGTPGFEALGAAYDDAPVEQLWRAELQRSTAWSPAFGVWQTVPGGFRSRITSPGSSVLLHDESPTSEGTWELSFECPAEANWPPGAVLGFAVACRGDQDYRYIAVRGEDEGVVYSRFLNGEWRSATTLPLAHGALTGGRLSLAIEGDGSMRVRLNGRDLASIPAELEVHEGRCGLMLELPAYGPMESGLEFTFRDVRLSTGRLTGETTQVR